MDQQPIDFKSMFQREQDQNINNNVMGYIFSMGWYFITMFVLSTVIFSIFYDVDAYTEYITPEMTINEALDSEIDRIFVLNNTDSFSSDAYLMIPYKDDSNYTIFVLKTTVYDVFDDSGNISYEKLIENPEANIELVTYNVNEETLDSLESQFIINDITGTNTLSLTSFANSLINIVVYVLLIVPIVWFMRSDLMFDYKNFLNLNKKVFGFIIAGYLYVVFGNIISNVFITFLEFVFQASYEPATNQLFIESLLQNDGMILMFIGAVILGPIVEELVFRKAIFGLIPKPNIALIVSSVIFALIHVFNELFTLPFLNFILTVIPYLTMGFVFGFIYVRFNKNIYIPILVHMLTNLISILGILLL